MKRRRLGGPLCWLVTALVGAGTVACGCSKAGSDAPGPSAATDAYETTTIAIDRVDGGTDRAEQRPQQPDIDTCARINRQRYKSREKLVCGPPGADGKEPHCHWRLRFSNGEFEWQYTDMLLSGKYDCEGLQIRETAPESHGGRLDPKSGHVFWDGVEYVPTTTD